MSAIGGVSNTAASVAGAGLVNLALAPLYAANQYIGSYFFGSGMILGERDMYQEDWPKIKKRLDEGELFLSILEEQTQRNTTAIMGNAQNIVIQISAEWNKIVFDYLKQMPAGLLQLLNIPLTDKPPGFQENPDFIPQPEQFNPPEPDVVIPEPDANKIKEAGKLADQNNISQLLGVLATYVAAVQANKNAGQDFTHNQNTVDNLLVKIKDARLAYKNKYGVWF